MTGTGNGANVRAVVACERVSPEERRGHGYGLEDQERQLRIQRPPKGSKLVEVVSDEGFSGPMRSGLRRMEDLIGKERCDVARAAGMEKPFRFCGDWVRSHVDELEMEPR